MVLRNIEKVISLATCAPFQSFWPFCFKLPLFYTKLAILAIFSSFCQRRSKVMIKTPSNQAWFWSEQWQEEEKEADGDIKAGRVTKVTNQKELISHLDRLKNLETSR